MCSIAYLSNRFTIINSSLLWLNKQVKLETRQDPNGEDFKGITSAFVEFLDAEETSQAG